LHLILWLFWKHIGRKACKIRKCFNDMELGRINGWYYHTSVAMSVCCGCSKSAEIILNWICIFELKAQTWALIWMHCLQVFCTLRYIFLQLNLQYSPLWARPNSGPKSLTKLSDCLILVQFQYWLHVMRFYICFASVVICQGI